jgi:MFS family permease
VATIIAMSLIDKAGRRTLLLIGSVGCALTLAGVAWIFASSAHEGLLVWLLVGFIGSFSFSQGAVIWVYLGEIFPNRVRAKGQSLGSFTHWFMNAIVSGTFPVVAAWSRSAPFAVFACMAVVQFFVVLKFLPETRGVSLEQMQKKLGIA